MGRVVCVFRESTDMHRGMSSIFDRWLCLFIWGWVWGQTFSLSSLRSGGAIGTVKACPVAGSYVSWLYSSAFAAWMSVLRGHNVEGQGLEISERRNKGKGRSKSGIV